MVVCAVGRWLPPQRRERHEMCRRRSAERASPGSVGRRAVRASPAATAAARSRTGAPSTDSASRSSRLATRRARIRATAAAEQPRDDEQPVKGQQNPYLIERLATVSTACDNTRRLPTPATMNHKPKTVLIVDDDEGMRDTLDGHPQTRVPRAARGERRSGACRS